MCVAQIFIEKDVRVRIVDPSEKAYYMGITGVSEEAF